MREREIAHLAAQKDSLAVRAARQLILAAPPAAQKPPHSVVIFHKTKDYLGFLGEFSIHDGCF
jgi:hypothetical protein